MIYEIYFTSSLRIWLCQCQVWQELRLELCQGGRRLSLVLGRMAFGRREKPFVKCGSEKMFSRFCRYWWRFMSSGLGVLRTCGSNQIWGCLRWRLCNEGEEVLVMWGFTICGFIACLPYGQSGWKKYIPRARWCYTDSEEEEWEYCSPPAEVSAIFCINHSDYYSS